jgi:hypothetical protein
MPMQADDHDQPRENQVEISEESRKIRLVHPFKGGLPVLRHST